MSISRLSGLVSLLVLGTLLSVWWYLQAPGAEVLPGSVTAGETAPASPAAPFSEADALPARATWAPARSERWSRRVSDSTGPSGWSSGPGPGSTLGSGGTVEGGAMGCPRKPAPSRGPGPQPASLDQPGT